jgi:hypothetical protein
MTIKKDKKDRSQLADVGQVNRLDEDKRESLCMLSGEIRI